jgi:hypothetical protein
VSHEQVETEAILFKANNLALWHGLINCVSIFKCISVWKGTESFLDQVTIEIWTIPKGQNCVVLLLVQCWEACMYVAAYVAVW